MVRFIQYIYIYYRLYRSARSATMLPDLPGCLAFQGGGRGATHHLHLGGATRGFFSLVNSEWMGTQRRDFFVFFWHVFTEKMCVCVFCGLIMTHEKNMVVS